ncbi:MAG: hypothetical protein HY548_07155 [Elusimicrobia bacterium]|nr:hypothetical protein [Elusimicrobiota bacterium]
MQTMEASPAQRNPVISWEFSKKQMAALNTLTSPDIDELLYGGAKGGGKTVFGSRFCYLLAKMIIKEFGLEPTQYPPVVGFMGRKQAVDFNTTTLNTWKREVPPEAYTLLEQKKLIVIEDCVALQFGGLDDSDTVRKFNSAEFMFYFLDQAEECSEEDVAMLRGTLRLKIKGRVPPWGYKGLLTANPKPCWLKPAFIITPQPRTKFIQALPGDNPYLPRNYAAQLKKAYGFNPALLKAYLDGSWEDLDQAYAVIPEAIVRKNVENGQHDKRVVKRITFADISGEGDDETVIYNLVNTKIESQEIYAHRDLMDTVGRIMAHAKKNESNLIGVDRVGIGEGVFSRLREVFAGDGKMRVYGFDGRVRPPEGSAEITYKNYKTYAWFRAADKFRERLCDIPGDEILINQLAGVTYHFTLGDILMLDRKEDLKEKLRHSPDRADCYVMALDALDHAEPVSRQDAYNRPRNSGYAFNPETC